MKQWKYSSYLHLLIFWFNTIQANVPILEKSGGWFLLAKCVNTSGKVTS